MFLIRRHDGPAVGYDQLYRSDRHHDAGRRTGETVEAAHDVAPDAKIPVRHAQGEVRRQRLGEPSERLLLTIAAKDGLDEPVLLDDLVLDVTHGSSGCAWRSSRA